ncbi:PREDICTED: kinesin-4 isoform X1 [Brassica oleracea var. oleracea]|uniref:Kinesin motor domain-containing protein n=2 Tax=Brassica oleracea var. oleracea TaxID=109376 RepID=A0A0D3CLH5_BRAOL|nr:PREDICTED: kinesin-4 isoform X1 [Brassica oleracea var. oleracea]XP_013637792.1 PREDICTED: kinesin-4 isoform X1 [Brassica oleracea var. oleracea]XP_013637793.1 PREDICTED: kinesin-4 isoform X1 [Brassica oleracea var. oleracea]
MTSAIATGLHEFHLASRRAEEAASRRFQAVQWLQSVVGQLGISDQPSEKEFVSCLRNGMVLCNAINKIHPGAVSKVVESYSHMQSFNREYQLPQAYQYFENVRNFLVALEQLRLPGFEASDLEKDNLEAGSVSKVVDCVLGLKAYHECKMTSSGNGLYKHVKTPTFQLSATKVLPVSASKTSRHLDRNDCADGESDQLKVIAKLVADHIFNSKENIDENLISLENDNESSTVNFQKIISRFPELQSIFKNLLNEGTPKPSDVKPMPLEELPVGEEDKSRTSLLHTTKYNHKRLLKTQENELAVLKTLFIQTKQDFKEFQAHLQRDLMELGNQMQEMSSAAQGYYKVVEENRKLYNMVQDLKGNIRVFCRVRPIFNSEMRGVIDYIGKDGSLFVLDPSKPQKDARKTFQFNQVFAPTATQDDVFRETQPLIRSVMDGYNVCIFAYGQTGSGKTYTMSGPPGRSATEMGINYLALNDLFLICDKRKDMMTYEIYVQMVEIYNEQVRDLLAENSSCTKLDIRTCSSEDDGLSLPDATMHSVNSTMDVLRLMEAGEVNRAVSSTSMNNRSSRSHSIFMVHVRGKDTSGGTIRSCLHLVDLAGSERVDKSEVTGDRLKEAQYINKSLSCLGDVIYALAQKNSHIPYRNSKLTLLLQDALGGQAKTLMFAHLSPEEDSFGETISTLKFAQRVSTVELGVARAHKETREVMHLKEQIESLKKALGSGEWNSVSYSGAKEIKSPLSRPIPTTERAPPRLRRLSIESCSNAKANLEDRKGVKSPLASRRAQRLSMEGPRSCKKEENSKGDSNTEVQQVKSPLSPPVSSYRTRAVKVDGRTSIPQLQLLQTPVKEDARNEIQFISVDSRTNGKSSHIRKSLRTIGKLINGSEKRKENIPANPRSPLGVSNNFSGVKSPQASNAKTLRRQSLTGVMPSGPERSRRSSIGGNPIESGESGVRTAKTPPPIRSSSKIVKKKA